MDVEARIKDAMYARKAYIKKNMETLTLKTVRRLLEKDLKMSAGEMDKYKSEAKEMLDRVLAEISDDNVKPTAPPSKAKVEKPKHKKSKERVSVQARPAAGASSQPPAVQKMQRICKQAGIGVGPNIYKKQDVAAAFEQLLAKHGLSAKSDASEIARVRKKLEEQRDMEGIDMSNIVEGGRRSRQQTSYRKMVEHDDEDDENEDEEPRRKRSKVTLPTSFKPTDGGDSDDFDALNDDDDDDDDRAPSKTAKSTKASKRARVVFDDDEDDDDEGEGGRGRARGITIAESTNTTAATKAEPPLAEPPGATSEEAEDEEEDEEHEDSQSASDEESDSDDDFDD